MSSARQISVGGVKVGGGAPVVVQSMTCTHTGDAEATLTQARALAAAGCELVRVSLPTAGETDAFARVVREAPAPIIADIHYDWRLALAAIECGAAGVRVNPGTLGEKHLREVVRAAAERDLVFGGGGREIPGPVAMRIGVNAGSLPRRLRPAAAAGPSGRAAAEGARSGGATAESATQRGRVPRGGTQRGAVDALVQAALAWAGKLEDWGYRDFKLSVKSSSVVETIAAYRALAGWQPMGKMGASTGEAPRASRTAPAGSPLTDAPLHVGVTEAGTLWSGTIKSAVGIGTLLAEGIGDTLRVSLTGDPVEEVRVAWKILAALGLRSRGPDVISCPTCGRTEVDVVSLANEVERRLAGDPRLVDRPLTVAVMGCRVNGPEEAKHADFGIAAGAGEGEIFVHGERVATVKESGLVEALFERIDQALV
ncbi:MAG TPA: flavodoxin-dependent (E)-4-hydroxy-3-methylbut-2-enyl-diphosphate synthase [Thermoleophilia bacterium]|nr:flavodoxin-dependent (E)-4-hydroxy-3-methylbut-2-enyl-diphosphate synthase [Thermoleophilia bacterium]